MAVPTSEMNTAPALRLTPYLQRLGVERLCVRTVTFFGPGLLVVRTVRRTVLQFLAMSSSFPEHWARGGNSPLSRAEGD